MNSTETIKRLTEALETISKDPDFIFCVNKLLKTDEDRDLVIRFIKDDERASYESVQLMALRLRQEWKREI